MEKRGGKGKKNPSLALSQKEGRIHARSTLQVLRRSQDGAMNILRALLMGKKREGKKEEARAFTLGGRKKKAIRAYHSIRGR